MTKTITEAERAGQYWTIPAFYWNYFSPILNETSSYSEFKMKCGILGYSGYSTTKTGKGMRVYDEFLKSESSMNRNYGELSRKAAKFWEQRENKIGNEHGKN